MYTSSKAKYSAARAVAGPVTITNTAPGAAHPYHAVHIDGSSTVYGWVDADTIKSRTAAPAQKPAPDTSADPAPADDLPAASAYCVTVGPITKGDVAHVLEALQPAVEQYQLEELVKTTPAEV